MGGPVFPPLLFTLAQTMVETKIMVLSSKEDCMHDFCIPCLTYSRPPLAHVLRETTQASLGQRPVWSLFLSPGSWHTRFCCALS